MESKFSEICQFKESGKFWTMDWDQFKDLIYYLCLIGYVVTPWYLMQGITGSNNPFSNKYFCH